MPSLLSIKDLSVTFSNDGISQNAVRNLSLELSAGEILAIVGESGSGKSVTALSILQLLPVQSRIEGQVIFEQKDRGSVNLLRLPPGELNAIRGREIAMIFQEPMTSLNPVITCGRQVAEVMQKHLQISRKEAMQKAIVLFEQVKLPDPASIVHRYPHQLSGGQKQRVMIAMAMSCNPSLLIADEPTTALDVTVQKTILELVASLQRQHNMGVILITHDLGVVADIADKIAVMYQGKIVENGRSREILTDPQHPYTKALLACRPTPKAKGKRLPVVSDFLGNPDGAGQVVKDPVQPEPDISAGPGIILEVKDLVVRFPARKNFLGRTTEYFNAVDGVSFGVMKGVTVGLVGESGCGKTTLGRAILQLIPSSSGKILLNGENIAGIKPAFLRRMRKDLQIVFQDPYGSLNPRITIGEAIMEPLKVHGLLGSNRQRKEKVMSLLEKVNLPADQFNRYPHQFSGGQRQRICVARALAPDPSFLIFDESVSALDISVQAQVLNLLSDLKKEFGFTAIFISHDLSVVHYACNRILVMNQGRILEEGDADQLFHHPKEEYTKNLIRSIPGKRLFA